MIESILQTIPSPFPANGFEEIRGEGRGIGGIKMDGLGDIAEEECQETLGRVYGRAEGYQLLNPPFLSKKRPQKSNL